MTTEKWAVEHTDKVLSYLKTQGINIVDQSIRDGLAHHIDDEIPGYCDNCELSNEGSRDREPSASAEARYYGEDRG